MNVEDLTIGEARKLVSMFAAPSRTTDDGKSYGWNVVVLDRGFVYVGEAIRDGDMLVMPEGRNIRYWGTTKGLHELVTGGPKKDTKIDAAAVVRIPMRAVISLHQTDAKSWKNC